MNQSSGVESDEDGVDDEPSSSSSSSATDEPDEDPLTSFRKQWKKELKASSVKVGTQSNSTRITNDANNEESTENQAKHLFLKGVEYEKNGRLYDAIRFYKRAVQLVPDIEFQLYESTKAKVKEKLESDDTQKVLTPDAQIACDNLDDNDDDDNDGEEDDLLVELTKVMSRNMCVCYPQFEQNTVHISALPMEIVLYILRWVVSSDLDLRSLEMFSQVCRGFLICARDPEIWRLACLRVWNVNCGNYEPKYHSWREMYINRPRVRYNGCYISKTTYIRQGENSFQDEFYRPWHFVEYFRYLRFFPEGRVLMLTSSDEMQSCVKGLKNRNPRNLSVLIGHFRLHDNCVTLVLKKQEFKPNKIVYRKKRREMLHDSGVQTFHVEFNIQNYHKRANWQLNWVRYNIFTQYKDGQETSICFNVYGRYPPFKFSRVKSYAQDSEAPL